MSQVKAMSWYVLLLVNHETKQFNIRIEDTPGVGKNSLAAYVWWMTDSIRRVDTGQKKPHPFWTEMWREVIKDVQNVEQVVIARISAANKERATQQFNSQRRQLRQFYKNMGYTGFGSSPAATVNDWVLDMVNATTPIHVYELILPGFYGGSDATDDHILWVATQPEHVDALRKLASTHWLTASQLSIKVADPTDADYHFPKDELALTERLKRR